MQRCDGRAADMPRIQLIEPGFVKTAAGSCLIQTGGTRVICTASVEEKTPPFLKGTGKGWLTAEYAMLPASTGQRKQRDGLKKDGRGVEIGRLIGRALRQAVDLERLGERTVTVDCDVLEADGGTRTASVTGGFVALVLAVKRLMDEGRFKESPVVRQVAAISCGVVGGECMVDLCYREDSAAMADVNVVMDDKGGIIEIQGTGEGRPITPDELKTLTALAEGGIRRLMTAQRAALGETAKLIGQKPKLVLASGNAHKAAEIKNMLGDRFDVVTMREAGVTDDIEETGATFAENAVIKAEWVMRQTGLTSIADDSGLCVDALDGAPGVFSARFAGTHGDDKANNALLVEKMRGVPEDKRAAKFVCALALASPFKGVQVFEGECPGRIIFEARGRDGFGYDPHFEYLTGKTFAEMTREEKNAVSHRARAMKKLREYIK